MKVMFVLLILSVAAAPVAVTAQAACSTAPPAVLNGRWPTSCTGSSDGAVCTAVCNARCAWDRLLATMVATMVVQPVVIAPQVRPIRNYMRLDSGAATSITLIPCCIACFGWKVQEHTCAYDNLSKRCVEPRDDILQARQVWNNLHHVSYRFHSASAAH
jgi:hypothetical protein